MLSQTVRLAGWRDVPSVMGEMAAEMERRQKEPDAEAPPIYLVIYGLQRCRDLRRREDDFGFGRTATSRRTRRSSSPTCCARGRRWAFISLIWCDTFTNLQRAVDRAGLRELALRVVFQMSVADSSNLIDNPLAAKLGVHRACFPARRTGGWRSSGRMACRRMSGWRG